MKKQYKSLLMACLLAAMLQVPFTAPLRAQGQTTGPVIVIIDIQRILKVSQAAQSVRTQLDARTEILKNEAARLDGELRDAKQELARQSTVLSEAAFEEKRQSFERRFSEAQRQFDRRKRQLDQAFQKALKEIQVAMLQVAQTLATEMNVDLVLPRSQVMFVNKDFDITDQVLAQLDQQLPAVTLTPEQAEAPAAVAPAPAAAE